MRNTGHMRGSRASADSFIEVDGARLRLRDEGQGFPVLLVHGWALDLDMWQPQVAAWAARMRVLRYDRRGFGLSTGSPSLAADMRDIESLLRRLNLQRVAIVGMSQGARGAMCAAAGPLRGRIACLILDGAPFDGSDSGEPRCPWPGIASWRGRGASTPSAASGNGIRLPRCGPTSAPHTSCCR
jgi:pimeloyl-ACP methyl ester carboxylesterase